MKMNYIKKQSDYTENIIDHLNELRDRIKIILFSVTIFFSVMYPFSHIIIEYLLNMLFINKSFISFYEPMEIIWTKIKIISYLSIIINIPLIIYQIFKFIERGLINKEYNIMVKIIPYSLILYFMSIIVSFKLVLPIFIKYVILYSNNIAIPQIDIATILNLIISITLGICILFQLPLVIIMLLKSKILNKETIYKNKYHIYFIIISISLMISPDTMWISKLIIIIISIVLFELSLIIGN